MFHVYVLRYVDDSLYVGSTQNLHARIRAHANGRGAAHTFKHRPIKLVYSEAFVSETEAVDRERQIKRWSGVKKDALIAGDIERLKLLSKRALRPK